MKIPLISNLSLGRKLFIVSLVLLVIPWMGSRYIQDMEGYLRSNQENLLLDRAQIIAAVFQSRAELFSSQPTEIPENTRHLYVRALDTPIQLDGYDEDWANYEEHMEVFGDKQLLFRADNYQPGSLQMQQQVGRYAAYLYAIFRIRDQQIVYRSPNSLRLDRNDYLEIALHDKRGEFRRYQIATIAPGWINAHLVDNETAQPIRSELQIKGEWQETADGFNIEIRIPLNMIGNRLSFTFNDVDDKQQRELVASTGASPSNDPGQTGTLMIPSEEVESLLQQLGRPSSRIWVIDQYSRVLGIDDRLNSLQDSNQYSNRQQDFFNGLLRLFYSLLLEQPTATFMDDLSSASRLDSMEFRTALGGQPMTHWRTSPDKRANILTAVFPVKVDQQVIGAIAIEETSQQILLMQNRAMEILLNLSILALLIAVLVLLVFASRLSYRIRRLRNQADNAIADDGRVQGEISHTDSGDEIGDLSRGISAMLHRLGQYNRYLETLAGKLSHELRTPVTVVRSSIENLEHDDRLSSEARQYTARAHEGIERLDNILTRMSEATRLEQTLQAEESEDFDLVRVISGCVEGYRIAHPGYQFTLNMDPASRKKTVHGSPELVAQLLDKLIDNAMDFSGEEHPIIISVVPSQQEIRLTVSNHGPLLPDNMQGQLFDSMVSVREKRGQKPHLGLGLYIVRLITEYHKGHVSAFNREDGTGVIFQVSLPISMSKYH